MEEAAPFTVVTFSPALRDDYLTFFDHDAFADNARWASCYCFFNHAPHARERWQGRTAEQNRSAVADLIDRGLMRGYLAYAGAKPIGWCNANLHSAYTTPDEERLDREHVGFIVCFVVAKPYRGMGVARRLLDAACAGFLNEGIPIVEAYARNDTQDAAANHHGPMSMYRSAGFMPVRDLGQITVLRKTLAR
jgi:GNAT superfamily N-acetyltransferase